jgi:TRAP-type C4-dicarboxylate transport system permease small subunit
VSQEEEGARGAPLQGRALRALFCLSSSFAAFEKIFVSALIALVALLILLNVFTRSFDQAIYWVDEAAIDTMVWATLVAASLLVRQRRLIAVTIVLDMVAPPARRAMNIAIDLIVLAFAAYFVWLCWLWFSPLHLFAVGFDLERFAAATGNFIYGEPTMTLGIPKFWVWLIVPVFSITLLVHALANAAETMTGVTADRASNVPE